MEKLQRAATQSYPDKKPGGREHHISMPHYAGHAEIPLASPNSEEVPESDNTEWQPGGMSWLRDYSCRQHGFR